MFLCSILQFSIYQHKTYSSRVVSSIILSKHISLEVDDLRLLQVIYGIHTKQHTEKRGESLIEDSKYTMSWVSAEGTSDMGITYVVSVSSSGNVIKWSTVELACKSVACMYACIVDNIQYTVKSDGPWQLEIFQA